MKKLCAILLVATIAFSVFAFTACGKEKNVDGNTDSEFVKMLNNFEDYKNDFEPLVLANYFGKVTVNKDIKFVKSGIQSAKIIPSGDITELVTTKPTLRQPLNLEKSGKNYSDIRKIESVSAWVYNDTLKNVKMEMVLQFMTSIAASKTFVLLPGWNSIVYKVYAEVLDFSYDISACTSVSFVFDRLEKGVTPPTLYLDDIVVHLTDKEYKSAELDLKANEILSFDKQYQEYVVRGLDLIAGFTPTLSLSHNSQFAKEGSSLRVDIPKNNGTLPTESYTGFDVMATYMGKVGMENYAPGDEFTFWIYNASTTKQRLFLELCNATNSKFFFKDNSIYIEPLSWKQVKYSFSKMNDGQLASDGTKNMGRIRLTWKASDIMENSTLYFDSFGVVKGSAE